jgi:acetyl-CoA/propionyl-CoA carboxylase biotin carboxyl carrier protein
VVLTEDALVVDGGEPLGVSGRLLPDGRVQVTLAGRTSTWHTALDAGQVWVGAGGSAWALHEQPRSLRADDTHAHHGDVTSPMPGSVIAVHAGEGDSVTKGQPLVVVEAMKMEHTLTAPLDGTVEQLLVRVGQQVKVDELLVTVTA